MKWWSGIDKVAKECENRLFTSGYTTNKWTNKTKNYKTTNVNVKDNKKEKKGESTENPDGGEDTGEIKSLTPLTQFLGVNSVDYKNSNVIDMGKYIAVEWNSDDPIQVPIQYISKRIQEAIAITFKALLNEGEKIYIDVFKAERSIDWSIYDEVDTWVESLLGRLEGTSRQVYNKFVSVMLECNMVEDASYFLVKEGQEEIYYPVPRTINYAMATSLLAEQEE